MNNTELSYPISEYKPKFLEGFHQLAMIRLSDCEIERVFDLTTATQLWVKDGNYLIFENDLTGGHKESFSEQEGETLTFSDAKMVGVTIVRIEGRLPSMNEFEFDLEICPVVLEFKTNKLMVKGAADLESGGYHTKCVKTTRNIDQPSINNDQSACA